MQASRANVPASNPELGEMGAYFAFGGRIIRGLNRAHIAATDWRCVEPIRHNFWPVC
jgi:hypothetical protein